jgi:hypothetical protein
MAETEYDDPKRIELLTALKEALNCDIPSTSWACLWLSDIDLLKGWVDDAQKNPYRILLSLSAVDTKGKIVQKCKFITFCSIDSLILYRDSTISRIIYSATNTHSAAITFTINNSTATISNFSTTTDYPTEYIKSR